MNTEAIASPAEAPAKQAALPHFDGYKAHILGRIERTPVGRSPFHHLFIENVFPDELYASVKAKALHYKRHSPLQPRLQDNKAFTNDRFSLVDNEDIETRYVHGLFSDHDIKRALLTKFFVKPDDALARLLSIHEEFEYVYTAKNRFQNIHVDVPAKFLSLVFYFPDGEVSDEERLLNATILYDKDLNPHQPARYSDNSVCIFAPHFHSYHGFATTIDRTALVMFYVDKDLVAKHQQIVRESKAAKRLEAFKDTIQQKLQAYPLLEYGTSHERLLSERKQCKINAPRGRVMRDGDQ